MSAPTIAILIVNWNGLEDTLLCLDALYASEENNFEVFLVDNGSEISPEEMIASRFPKVHYIASKSNLGFAAGNNLAMTPILERNFTYLLLLNNDTLVSPGFLSPLYQTLEQNDQLNAVQPCIYFIDQPNQIWSAGGKWNKWMGDAQTITQRPSQSLFYHCDWLTGCAMLIRTTALKHTGGFNPQFFAYYEDVDLSFRLNKNKNQLAVVPNSVIWHKAGGSVRMADNKEGNLSPLVHFWNWRNRIWIMKKYQPTLLLLVNAFLLIPQFLLTCLYFIARRRWSKLNHTYKGFRDGLRDSIN
jgi:GT2 family glycosyltransferase